jgi:hypothetical protein
MNKKSFIAQQGSSTTIKIFDASNGQLYRIISVGGNIISTPVISDSVVTVTVEIGKSKMIKIFNLPSGGLKSVIPL